MASTEPSIQEKKTTHLSPAGQALNPAEPAEC